jgi:hypothetical protein
MSVPSSTFQLARFHLTYRFRADGPLPEYKGGVLRGGFGTAFQQVSCPQACWQRAADCPSQPPCNFRRVFQSERPAGSAVLQGMEDAPRPFVIELSSDRRRWFRIDDTLSFTLILIGSGIAELPHFLHSFDRLGQLGLGPQRTPARLERVTAVHPWREPPLLVYDTGVLQQTTVGVPVVDGAEIARRAAQLPAHLWLAIRTPLRLKQQGAIQRSFNLTALVRAMALRLTALTAFYHPDEPAPRIDYNVLLAQAADVQLRHANVRWVDWERTSTNQPADRTMNLGGIVGAVELHHVAPELRALLLAGSLVHVGKACVFGHGAIRIEELRPPRTPAGIAG